jgi:5-(carboxyamino)imidazole ribonucleotide mutase
MSEQILVGIVMGSKSDYEILLPAIEILRALEIPCEARVLSAHRTPGELSEYAETARARGLRVLIAGAGGAAHLAGVMASKTLLPVLGVPVVATPLNGLDSLLSIVQMPKGIPVGTLAIGKPGAANAARLRFWPEPMRRSISGWRRGVRRAPRKCWIRSCPSKRSLPNIL